MSYWYLKCGEDVDVTYSVTLENNTYDLRIRWNDRDQSWKAFIGLTGQEPSAGFKITNGFNLLRPYYYLEGIPPGSLYLIDSVSLWGRPSFDNLGLDERFKLLYIDSDTEDFLEE